MRSLAAVVLGCALLAGATLATAPVLADPSTEQKAAAQVLFDEGRKLMGKKRHEQACAKFAESMRLDAQVGTQLNLARCYEKVGRLASAWINWVEAAQRAEAAGRPDRVKIAEERAAALEPELSYLTIVVEDSSRGLTVTRNGEAVGRAQWGSELPVDSGEQLIAAEAPGKQRYEKRLRVSKKAGQRLRVAVPALADAIVEEPSRAQLGVGIAFTVLGGVGVGLGIGFGVDAMSKNDDSLAECPEVETRCTPAGVGLREDAFTAAHASTASFVIGATFMLTGVVLMATAPSASQPEVGLVVGPGTLGLRGWW